MRSTAFLGRRPGDAILLETGDENRDEHRDALVKGLDVSPVFPVNDVNG
jgi:hypothetical protein